jgi:hypothetical protein
MIAAKLLAWPLIIWLLVTGRGRRAGVAAGTAVALVLASWAPIGFAGRSMAPRCSRPRPRSRAPCGAQAGVV